MKDSEILIAAKNSVSLRGHRICYAISSVKEASQNQRKYLVGWITQMLGDEPYYDTWMTKNHPELRKYMTQSDFITARLQWMDWMIAECWKAEA